MTGAKSAKRNKRQRVRISTVTLSPQKTQVAPHSPRSTALFSKNLENSFVSAFTKRKFCDIMYPVSVRDKILTL
jgi:hypothetical protein